MYTVNNVRSHDTLPPAVGSALPAGHNVVASAVLAPRNQAELDHHVERVPDIVASLERDSAPPEHRHTAGFTEANTNAALSEAFRVLAGPEQMAVLTNVVLTEAGVVAKQVSCRLCCNPVCSGLLLLETLDRGTFVEVWPSLQHMHSDILQ